MRRLSCVRGFSLLELVVAAGLSLALAAMVFRAVASSRDLFAVGLEAAEREQRLRVALATLTGAIGRAGVAGHTGADGAGRRYDAPFILPFRVGAARADPSGVFRPGVLTVIETRGVLARLASPLPAASGAAAVDLGPGCALAPVPCGLARDMQLLATDAQGGFDLYEVRNPATSAIEVEHLFPDSGRVYEQGSGLMVVGTHTFFLKTDPRTGITSLMTYDGSARGDVPVVDHVVGLRFDYWGERLPPVAQADSSVPGRFWATYGPAPPAIGLPSNGFADGENCVFARDAASRPVSRLAHLGGGAAGVPGLVRLDAAVLVDGPWCPDDSSPSRYDADLLRIRAVDVWLRVQAAAGESRGARGPLFSRAGTALQAGRWVPDAEIRVRVTPRGLGEVP